MVILARSWAVPGTGAARCREIALAEDAMPRQTSDPLPRAPRNHSPGHSLRCPVSAEVNRPGIFWGKNGSPFVGLKIPIVYCVIHNKGADKACARTGATGSAWLAGLVR